MFINLTTAQNKFKLQVNVDNVAFVESTPTSGVQVVFSETHSIGVDETYDEIQSLIDGKRIFLLQEKIRFEEANKP